MARLRHPVLAEVYDFDVQGDSAFVVMEHLPGLTLQSWSDHVGKLARNPGLAAAIVGTLADGLAFAHRHGVVHRALNPENVFLIPALDGGVGFSLKIVDFGLARMVRDQPPARTRAGGSRTPFYRAPEQWRQARSIDQRADVYALGCILFELLSGRPPFCPSDDPAVVRAHLADPPPDVTALEPEVPARFQTLIARMLAKAPEHRHPSMENVRTELESILGTPTLPVDEDAAHAPRGHDGGSRNAGHPARAANAHRRARRAADGRRAAQSRRAPDAHRPARRATDRRRAADDCRPLRPAGASVPGRAFSLATAIEGGVALAPAASCRPPAGPAGEAERPGAPEAEALAASAAAERRPPVGSAVGERQRAQNRGHRLRGRDGSGGSALGYPGDDEQPQPATGRDCPGRPPAAPSGPSAPSAPPPRPPVADPRQEATTPIASKRHPPPVQASTRRRVKPAPARLPPDERTLSPPPRIPPTVYRAVVD